MHEPGILDVAQLKADMRAMYNHVGRGGSLQVLYEMMYSARVLAEVIMEERAKNETT